MLKQHECRGNLIIFPSFLCNTLKINWLFQKGGSMLVLDWNSAVDLRTRTSPPPTTWEQATWLKQESTTFTNSWLNFPSTNHKEQYIPILSSQDQGETMNLDKHR